MRTRLAEWLRGVRAARRRRARSSSCVQRRRRTPRGAVAGAGADRPARARAGQRPRRRGAHLPRLVRAAAARSADRSAGASSACAPDMQLVEDLDDLRPELMRRFHAARAGRCRAARRLPCALRRSHGRTTLQKWLDAAWQRRVEIELADAAGVARGQRRARRSGFAECAGLAHPATLVRQPALHRCRACAGTAARRHAASPSRDEAAHGLADGAGTARRRRAAFDAPAQRAVHRRGHAAQAARRPAGAGRAVRAARAHRRKPSPSRRRMTSTAAWCGCRARCSPPTRALKRAARPGRHGRPRARRAGAAGRPRARRLGAAAARRARAPPADRRVPGHQPAAMARAAGLAVGLRRAPAAAARRACSSSAIPKQSIYRFRRAEPRVFDAAQRFVVDGLGGTVAACDHTRRNAPAVLAAVNHVFGELAAEGGIAGWRPHTHRGRRRTATARRLHAAQRRARQDRARSRAGAGSERVWRDTLTTPRHEPEAVLREAEAAVVARAVHALVHERRLRAGRDLRAGAQARLAAPGGRGPARRCTCPMSRPRMWRWRTLPEVQDLLARARRAGLARPGAVAGARAEEPAVRRRRRRPAVAVDRGARRRRLVAGIDAGGRRRGAGAGACAHAAGAAGARPRRGCRRTTCSTASFTRAT